MNIPPEARSVQIALAQHEQELAQKAKELQETIIEEERQFIAEWMADNATPGESWHDVSVLQDKAHAELRDLRGTSNDPVHKDTRNRLADLLLITS